MQGKIETRVGIFVIAALAIFAYMGFQIGAFRFDYMRYDTYTMHFKDITGLSRKADIKIAGVKVGWVEAIKLLPGEQLRAETQVMILKDYTLYSDAHAMVRQDGLLGPKYIEVVPGDPLLQVLKPEDALKAPSVSPVSIDELLQQFKEIATNVNEVTASFSNAVGGMEGKVQLREIFDNIHATTDKLASFSDTLDRSLSRNEGNIDALLKVGSDIRHLAQRLENDVFPSFQKSVEKISDVFDRDFNRVATKIETTAETFEEASAQARDGLRSVSSVAEKIDQGKGLLGKLVNDDETYKDLKVAVRGFKNYLTKVDRMQIVFDSHFETMSRPAENYRFEDAKGYFDMRIHPNQDHFYMLQLATSEKGFLQREDLEVEYKTKDDLCRVDLSSIDTTDPNSLPERFRQEKLTFKRNTVKIGIQFGKIFHDVAFRFGLFEGSAGFGVDVDIPFRSDKFRWVTTFEAFDMAGWNRKEDRRPHVKWVNKMFLFRNIYFTFGADDFASKRNASTFFGAGLRFGDENVKYFLSSISGGPVSNFAQG